MEEKQDKSKRWLFSVAPMMDWSESSSVSTSYKASCARRVHWKIKKNPVTAKLHTVGPTGIADIPSAFDAAGRLAT